jgi:hypothetical protein
MRLRFPKSLITAASLHAGILMGKFAYADESKSSSQHQLFKSNTVLFDDCASPACADKHSKLMQSFASVKTQDKPTDSRLRCPLDREDLGKSAWNLIHTMAANFPEKPTEEEKLMAEQFAHAIAHLFPCRICSRDFQLKMKSSPLT